MQKNPGKKKESESWFEMILIKNWSPTKKTDGLCYLMLKVQHKDKVNTVYVLYLKQTETLAVSSNEV